MPRKNIFIIVLLISTLTLLFELLQTRILSVVLWYHFVYIVITMALLGFAASGTALSVFSRLKNLSDQSFYSLCLMGFSLTAYFSARFGYYPISNVFSTSPDPGLVLSLVITYTISMLPYFFAGLAIIGSFMRFSNLTGILYFANLLGSGLGCILFILLIRYMGAPRLLLLNSLISLIPVLVFIKSDFRKRGFILLWSLFLFISLLLPLNSKLNQILPERHKNFWTWFSKDTDVEYTEWNPISRIDVISHKQFPRYKNILMDGDAQAMLYDIELVDYTSKRSSVDRKTTYTLLNKDPERVLVIGAGGGFDVLLAVLNKAKRIDAVEINPSTAYIISDLYSSHINNIFSYPEISLFVEDGRSFIRRTKNKYDIIMMYATDSVLALSTGAYVLSDNFLYTKEAFTDCLNHLTADGFIHIGRWEYAKKPRETLRVFSTALEACRNSGYTDPLSHIVAISPSPGSASVIFKRKPFSKEEKERLSLFCSQNGITVLFPKGGDIHADMQDVATPFSDLADSFLKNAEYKFYSEYEYNVLPTNDDSPFFYQYNKWSSKLYKNSIDTYYDSIRGIWHIFVLSLLLIHSIVLSLILVILPLIVAQRNKISFENLFFVSVYFLSIGFGYMFLEMGVVQKFVLFLGSPIYSMAIVIPAILISSGLGSLSSYFIKNNIKLLILLSTLISSALIFLITYLIPHISKIFLLQPFYARVITVIVTISPLAFFMGFPFPLAVKAIRSHANESLPYAWAINGSSSVIASIIAVIIAMQFGFKMVLTTSAAFYIIAALSTLFYSNKPNVS